MFRIVGTAWLLFLPLWAQRHNHQGQLGPACNAYLLGSWDCTGQSTDNHGQKKGATVGHLAVTMQGDGWMIDQFEHHTAKGDTYASTCWAQFAEHTKKWRRYCVNNENEWGLFETNGWQGDIFAWTGKLYRPWRCDEVVVQQQMHKQDDNTFAWLVETHEDGRTIDVYRGVCRRQAPDEREVE